MLDLTLIRSRTDEVRQGLASRQAEAPLDRILELDSQRRSLLAEAEALRAQRNLVSKEIATIAQASSRQEKIAEMRSVGDRIGRIEAGVRETEEELNHLLASLPNLPDPRTPIGSEEGSNVVLRSGGEPRPFDFPAKPHWDLGPQLGILNFEQGARMTGSRFYVLHGAGARLQRALIAWMLELHVQQGYREAYPPFLVRSQALFGAGQLPKFADNLYHDAEEDLWLVPTAEVPLTNLHADEILEPEVLPLWYVSYTPCFRREKMAAGRDVRGIKRGHQFDKVEMYKFCTPQSSDSELERMLADAEETCRLLGLAYRIKVLCTGDLGFSAQRTYDVEVWAPGCQEWLEVSSISNCGDFQARRANIRYRPARGAHPEFVHTLNGSGLGLPRTLIAVLENGQTRQGTVRVPPVLWPWMGGIEEIEPAHKAAAASP